MKAIILAAGRGSRMLNLTSDKPKCLLKFRNKSLIDWQLNALTKAGVDDIAIVSGYRSESLSYFSNNFFYNPEWQTSNIFWSLIKADPWLSKYECIVSYSDIIYTDSVINLLSNSMHDFSISYDSNWLPMWKARFNNPLEDAETFKIDNNRRLLEIGNKPDSLSDVQGQYMGLLKFTPKSWEIITKGLKNSPNLDLMKLDITAALKIMISSNIIEVVAEETTDPWFEFDKESDFSVAEKYLVDHYKAGSFAN